MTKPFNRNIMCIARRSFPGKRVFLGAYIVETAGLGKLLGMCLKNVRFTKKQCFTKSNSGSMIGGRIRYILRWEFNGKIYIPTTSKRNFICIARGSDPGKRVFLGTTMQRKWARKAFIGRSVLKCLFY